MEGESGRRLTMVAQIKKIRIDFLRPQIAHVLRANMTGKTCQRQVPVIKSSSLTFSRKDGENAKT